MQGLLFDDWTDVNIDTAISTCEERRTCLVSSLPTRKSFPSQALPLTLAQYLEPVKPHGLKNGEPVGERS